MDTNNIIVLENNIIKNDDNNHDNNHDNNSSSSFEKMDTWMIHRNNINNNNKYHGHFDCFSGAAGDMMLASCFDVAGQMMMNDTSSTTDNFNDNNDNNKSNYDNNIKQFQLYIIQCLKLGLPQIANEFNIQYNRVYRSGMGSIAAIHINVDSIYHHKPTSIPSKTKTNNSSSTEVEPIAITKTMNHPETAIFKSSYMEDDVHYHQYNVDVSTNGTNTNDSSIQKSNQETIVDDDSSNNKVVMNHDYHSHDHHSHEHHSHEHGHEHPHENSHGHSHQHSHDHVSSIPNAAIHSHDNHDEHNHQHDHQHNHQHNNGTSHNHHDHNDFVGPIRNLPDIRQMLLDAPEDYIPIWVRDKAILTFTLLAKAEAAVHGATNENTVHFHEVGAIDSIIDTVGTLIALYTLGITSISCSRLPFGEGMVCNTAHGILPIPSPATLYLMKGMSICPGPPGYTGELVTPTGIALLRALTIDTNQYPYMKNIPIGRPPRLSICYVGVGAGTKDFHEHPNIIRFIVGDS